MKLAAALVYWPIVATWLVVLGTVLYFFRSNPRAYGTTRLLLAVVGLDTLRNIVENIYFGFYFGGQYGFFADGLVPMLGQPTLLIIPKLLNLTCGCLVLGILLLHWLPAATRERQTAERTTDELREVAMHDALTGLVNRGEFMARAEREWLRAWRYGRPLSMLMLDIDLFKTVNDSYGHGAGDQVLIHVAKIYQSCARTTDVVARLGGEEFGVLLPETDAEAAYLFAERLRLAVAQRKVTVDGIEIGCTVSIGVSEAGGLDTLSALIRSADIALYEAKHTGRNRVRAYNSPDEDAPALAVA